MLPRVALARVNVHLGGRHILHDITWSLRCGQHWAIVGPNGSGKSTLLRVIAGSQWIQADSGTRTYSPDGRKRDPVARAAAWIRIVSAEQHERYARLDLTVSGRHLVESGFADSVYVHAALTPDQTASVDALLDRLQLSAIALRPMRELSTGQMRRLLIARALAGGPRVLVLDECTNGLDRAARRDVLALLDRLASNVALVVTSHRGDDFPSAITDTATLRDGRLVETAAGRPRQPCRRAAPRREPAVTDGRDVLVKIRHADVYRGKTVVLRDVDWQLRSGEHTLIRGANGAGKSTFAGLLAGTVVPATGAFIERFGERGPFDIWKLKERVAHVSDDLQIAYTYGETVEDVVASGFPASIGLFVKPTAGQRKIAGSLLVRLALEPLSGRTFTQLSFGERRKVLIARSLVRRPAIFILDEVWNGLDAAFRHALRDLIVAMAHAGTTIVSIAHDEQDDLASLAPRVCWIENGVVYDERTPPTSEA